DPYFVLPLRAVDSRRYETLYLLVSSVAQLPLVSFEAARSEEAISVSAERRAKRLASVHDEHLRPEIEVALGRWRARQDVSALERLEQFAKHAEQSASTSIAVLAGLVDHQHVDAVPPSVRLPQPADALVVDEVHVRILFERLFPLLGGAVDDGVCEVEVVELLNLLWPYVVHHVDRSDYEHALDDAAVAQYLERLQGDGRLANSGVPKEPSVAVLQHEADALYLILVAGLEDHLPPPSESFFAWYHQGVAERMYRELSRSLLRMSFGNSSHVLRAITATSSSL